MIYSFNGIDNLLGTSSRQWRARSDQILSKNRTERSAHCYCTVPLSNRLKQPHSSRLFHPVDKKEDINLHVTRATNLSICRVCVLPPPAFNHTTNSQSQRGKMCPIYKQTFYSPPLPKSARTGVYTILVRATNSTALSLSSALLPLQTASKVWF